MKLQTNCAWRQMNLLRCARHAGGLHHRKKQFKLVDVHWHSWGTRTPGKPGVLSESPKIARNIHHAQPLTSITKYPTTAASLHLFPRATPQIMLHALRAPHSHPC